MIALGLTPGLGALAYSVLQVNGSAVADAIDSDVLHAGRGVTPRAAWQVAKRIAAHQLILDVILERHPPAIVAVGPPGDPSEPEEAIVALRLALHGLGSLLQVPVYDFPEPASIAEALGVPKSQLNAGVQRRLSGALASRDKRIMLATGAALAAAQAARQT